MIFHYKMSNMLYITLIVIFIHACTWQGMILEKVRTIIKPEGMIYKPIYGCPICMTPWWGTLIYWIFFHISWQDWFLTVGGAAGLTVIAVTFIDARDAFLKYYNN